MKLLDSVKSSWSFFFEESTGDIIWKLKNHLGDVSYCPEDILTTVFMQAGLTDGPSYSQYLRHYVGDGLDDYSDQAMEDEILLNIITSGVKGFSPDDMIALCERIGLSPVDVHGFKSILSSESKSRSVFFLPALALSLQREDIGLVASLQMGMELSRDKQWESLSQKFHSSSESHLLALLIALHRDWAYSIQNEEEALMYAEMLIRLDTVHQGDDRIRSLLLALLRQDGGNDEKKLQEYAKQNIHLLVANAEDAQVKKLTPWFIPVEKYLRSLLPKHDVSLDELGLSWDTIFPITPGADYIPGIDERVKRDPKRFKQFVRYVNRISGFEDEDNYYALIRLFTGHAESGRETKPRWDCNNRNYQPYPCFSYIPLLYIVRKMFPPKDRSKFPKLMSLVSFENKNSDIPWEKASQATDRNFDSSIKQAFYDFYGEIFTEKSR